MRLFSAIQIAFVIIDHAGVVPSYAQAAELAANLAEIDATLNSPLMTEDPNLAASAMSPYRVRRDHYKGMTDTERRAILATQLAQMEVRLGPSRVRYG